MILNKDGTITYEITNGINDDTLEFEKMLGFDRDKSQEEMNKLLYTGKASLIIMDSEGNYTKIDTNGNKIKLEL
jgi:hypothetical protein|tara:strand:- start:280 stop:501 length:222 start_codon:yes stop_codon:yes gene_type:complete